MAQNVPEKQWAQVIEKTGGPVEYKEIPGELSLAQVLLHYDVDNLQLQSLAQTKFSLTSNTPEFAIPIYML